MYFPFKEKNFKREHTIYNSNPIRLSESIRIKKLIMGLSTLSFGKQRVSVRTSYIKEFCKLII